MLQRRRGGALAEVVGLVCDERPVRAPQERRDTSARSVVTDSGANSARTNTTASAISSRAGSSRRARRVQKPRRSSRPVRPSSSSRREVIKNPLRTKKTSTPMKPPATPGMPPWPTTTSATAMPLMPLRAGTPWRGVCVGWRRPRGTAALATHRRCPAERDGAAVTWSPPLVRTSHPKCESPDSGEGAQLAAGQVSVDDRVPLRRRRDQPVQSELQPANHPEELGDDQVWNSTPYRSRDVVTSAAGGIHRGLPSLTRRTTTGFPSCLRLHA